jgi:hypothetical protein
MFSAVIVICRVLWSNQSGFFFLRKVSHFQITKNSFGGKQINLAKKVGTGRILMPWFRLGNVHIIFNFLVGGRGVLEILSEFRYFSRAFFEKSRYKFEAESMVFPLLQQLFLYRSNNLSVHPINVI